MCDGCGTQGHRLDVCASAVENICKLCGEETPGEDHQCMPECALCGKNHATEDNKCWLRYQTPYELKKRKSGRAAETHAAELEPGAPPPMAAAVYDHRRVAANLEKWAGASSGDHPDLRHAVAEMATDNNRKNIVS
ncbi:hypothetical protein HPB48_016411 [Haemaphysalis longicornis]|uniref:Uncharacterized protein n=1 Tax=Haemaphysalis longicornis TaxID=44386 RepID=A0A9J6FPV3_HAELO|nr:hypothetical protein HPB48_016411 [Haemaphysalis longicornis]